MTTLLEIETGRKRPPRGSHEPLDGGHIDEVDPRLTFLARAHARFILFESGEIDLDHAIADLPCTCRWQS